MRFVFYRALRGHASICPSFRVVATGLCCFYFYTKHFNYHRVFSPLPSTSSLKKTRRFLNVTGWIAALSKHNKVLFVSSCTQEPGKHQSFITSVEVVAHFFSFILKSIIPTGNFPLEHWHNVSLKKAGYNRVKLMKAGWYYPRSLTLITLRYYRQQSFTLVTLRYHPQSSTLITFRYHLQSSTLITLSHQHSLPSDITLSHQHSLP